MFDGETTPQPPSDAGEAFEQAFLEQVSGAPAATEPAPVERTTPDTSAEPAPEGQRRDEQGRFVSTSPPVEPTPAPAAAAPPPETPEEPTPKPQVEGQQPPAETGKQVYPELSYRADGQPFKIPGSAVGDQGAFIPKEQLPELSRLLAAGRTHLGSFQQRLRDSSAREQRERKAREAAETQRDFVLKRFDDMIEQDTIDEWLSKRRENWPVLKAEAKAKAVELELAEERKARETFEQEQEKQRMEPIMREELSTAVLEYGQAAGLDREAMEVVYARLCQPRWWKQVFRQATAEDRGYEVGQWLIELGLVEDEVATAARLAKRQGAAGVTDTKAGAGDQPGKKVPPTVAARQGPPPKAQAPAPKYGSAEEADAAIWGSEFKTL